MRLLFAAVLLALLPLSLLPRTGHAAEAPSCAPSQGLSFICGLSEPEDLVQIGDTKWIIASGMDNPGALSLIDADAKTARRFFTGQSKPDAKTYPDCAAPDPAKFNSHGLALIPAGKNGLYTLYTVTHAPFESIQVFAVDARWSEPAIAWKGCVKLPPGFTNGVTAKRDGTILVDVQMRGTLTQADFLRGAKTGGVYEWTPARKTLRLLPGTELPGNNGIEISPDEKQIYVAVSGTQSVAIFDLADTAKGPREVKTPWWNVDNVHWSNGRLLAAGQVDDEPACGGTRLEVINARGNRACHRGWVVGELDPVTLTFRTIAYGEPNPAFSGAATALIRNDVLWLSSFQMDRVAWKALAPR
jgi:hypothetical protein